MKKKLLSMILAAVMATSVCACGSQSSGAGSDKSEEQTLTAENSEEADSEAEEYIPVYPIVDEPITVTGLVVGADTSVSDSRLVWDLVEEITGINIEWINIDADAVSTFLAGGDWPDFFHNVSLSSSEIYDYGVLGGRFINYFDYLDIMPNMAKTLEDYPLALAASTELNGEMYHLFKVGGPSSTATTSRSHVRLDVLEAAGIKELPTTVDELYDQLVILKEKNGEPGMVYDTGESGMVRMLFAAFGPLHLMTFDNDDSGNIVYSPVTDQMKHYYEYVNKLYEEGLMNQEWLTMDKTAKNQLAKSGKVAYITTGAAETLSLEDLNGNWDNLGTVAPLTSEYDDTRTLAGHVDYRDACGMYINKDSKYVEEICKMLDIAYATEEVVKGTGLYGQAFIYGLEGVDWILNDDGTYEQIVPEKYDSFSAYQEQELRWKDFGRADSWGLVITSTPGNAQARQKGYVSNVIPYQIKENVYPTGLLKFTEEEQYILDNKYTDISNYTTKMEAEFITGVTDIEEGWDEYVATCEKMGLSEVLDVYQAAYDRWNESMILD